MLNKNSIIKHEVVFDKDITKDKHIYSSDTLAQYYLIAFVLEQNELNDEKSLDLKIKKIFAYEIEVIDDTNGAITRYVYNAREHKVMYYSSTA